MTLKEYQERIIPTEHWPKEMGAIYPAIGLGGEAGEVLNEIKKVYRDDGGNFAFRLNTIASEIGDVIWYLASLANCLGLSLDDCLEISLNKVENKTWENNEETVEQIENQVDESTEEIKDEFDGLFKYELIYNDYDNPTEIVNLSDITENILINSSIENNPVYLENPKTDKERTLGNLQVMFIKDNLDENNLVTYHPDTKSVRQIIIDGKEYQIENYQFTDEYNGDLISGTLIVDLSKLTKEHYLGLNINKPEASLVEVINAIMFKNDIFSWWKIQ